MGMTTWLMAGPVLTGNLSVNERPTHHRREWNNQDDGEGHKGQQVSNGSPQRLHLPRLQSATCRQEADV